MIIKTKDWREACQLVALDYATESMASFQRKIQSCVGYLPQNDGPNRSTLLDIFLDCATGTVVKLSVAGSANLSREFEDSIVAKFRRQFNEERKRQLGVKGQEGKIEVEHEKEVH